MKVPRIETIIARNNEIQSNKGMRIPSDLGRPYIDIIFQGNTPDCTAKNNKLNFIA